ncbi:MAG: bifunctional proline dehydrogenase/L-glutamate gamma-semialdehyde dehydrogenase PutA, partial [Gammaproteobacteria bacterium]
MLLGQFAPTDNPYRQAIRELYYVDEEVCVNRLLNQVMLLDDQKKNIHDRATNLVKVVRDGRFGKGGIDAFMLEYELSSAEGVALMCLAEALLRIPDKSTADRLIRDKLGTADWKEHLGGSNSLFVNASTWGLMLTGRVIKSSTNQEQRFLSVLKKLIARSGEPIIRQAVRQAMGIMGRQFVLGRHIDEALNKAIPQEKIGNRYSYDMLGEAACTDEDAKRYFQSYALAIEALSKAAAGRGPIEAPGISVKLSALHPRFEYHHSERLARELVSRVRELALMAKQANIGFTIDAEETHRLELQLDVFEALALDAAFEGWMGLGLAIQAYQKRCVAVIDWLVHLGERSHRQFMVRLVKGAYWDSEVKRAQEMGLSDYPVFTRKINTDVSYLACARKLLARRDVIFPQFATHNAHTVAAIQEIAGDKKGFEFQRLHGMGKPLFDQVLGDNASGVPCRIYAPVGSHEDLLPYLVRRLLENGANSSFVNRLVDDQTPIDDIVADPVEQCRNYSRKRHPRIAMPAALFADGRLNSAGLDVNDPEQLRPLSQAMSAACEKASWFCVPIVGADAADNDETVPAAGTGQAVRNPARSTEVIGTVVEATSEDCEKAMATAHAAQVMWNAKPVDERASILEQAADCLQENQAKFFALAMREAGKTLLDCVAELREAIDFLRYYARLGRQHFALPVELPGPTGEQNQLSRQGRGVFVCISPWNFPLAIFIGQISAALVAGNAVVAKPAEQTSIMAYEAVKLLHEAGVPRAVLQLVPGAGDVVGPALLGNRYLSGVAFTGGTDTAKRIHRQLAERPGAIVPLIAETGGLNTMIVDSSALPEQVVRDVVASAFQSAGQRCSACRVLYLQAEIADKVLDMLKGAMQELVIRDPRYLNTDVGPVIDQAALTMLQEHADRMDKEARLIAACKPVTTAMESGFFFGPRAYELESLSQLPKEVFGPVLHVLRYQSADLDQVVDE